ncbi:DUF6325 family protein [Microbacterium sp.]|uniref:DUF6325 family protein n=1 Tax=Microbacterium sp. TaxID=51671 RepID=UPI003A8EFA4D
MVEFRYGPVEFYLVGFDGEAPDQSVADALVGALNTGLVRLIDYVLVSKSAEGEVTVTEVDDATGRYSLGDIDLAASGLLGEEDIAEYAELVPPGRSAALVAVELVYQRELASRLAATGAEVLGFDRVPAPVVNALVDALESEGD